MQTTTQPADTQTELDLDQPRPLRETRLRVVDHGSLVQVRSGGYLITAYSKTDTALRNLAIVALTESNVRGYRVGELFGLSPVQISRIRGAYREHGAAGLVKPRGRPNLLDQAQIRQARAWAAQKVSKAEIARRLNVSRPTIVELLNQHGPLETDLTLDSDHPWDSDQPQDGDQSQDGDQPGDQDSDHTGDPAADAPGVRQGADETGDQPDGQASARQPADETGDQAGDQATVRQPSDETGDQPDSRATQTGDHAGHQAGDQPDSQAGDPITDQAGDRAEDAGGRDGGDGRRSGGGRGPVALACGTVWSRYAGAMLTHAFTTRIGAGEILARAVSAPGAGLDATDLMVCNATRMGFTLGALTLEQAKHLRAQEAGPLTGWSALPSLRTWRTRLGGIGDRVDPLRLHRDLITAMLDYTPPARGVVFADDHVVEYTGGKPLAWGRNPRRGKATKAHDDTYICDLAGRALIYATGEPSGLSATLPGVLTQLTTVWPAATTETSTETDTTETGETATAQTGTDGAGLRAQRPIVVFDRGASYPATFTTVHDAGYDFICFRRAPLATPTRLPVCATIRRAGHDIPITYTDEHVQINGYDHPLRQITLFEHGTPVAQLLSSDLHSCPGLLLALLRARWRIENFLEYTSTNYGIDTLADYTATYQPDTHPIPNPAHTAAKATETTAKTALATAKTALADLIADPTLDPATKNTRLPAAHQTVHDAEHALAAATAAKKTHRAKLPRNQIHPDAQRAHPRTGRRCLQLTLRLLAANAENDLAHALNTYLHDDDEYRAITRETILRGLAGTITYTPTTITVTLQPPDQPHITRALTHLLHDLNQTPPTIPGDPRPITYHLQPT